MTEAVFSAYAAQLRECGNPSSLHAEGQGARMRMESARARVAEVVGAQPAEVVFTAGGTEADNLALTGIHAARNRDAVRAGMPARPRVLISAIEHHAVLETAEHLESEAYGGTRAELVLLPVDRTGRLDLDAAAAAIAEAPERTSLVSVMLANNEVGTVQPVTELVRLAHAHGIPVHTDAVQALGQLPLDFAALGVDAMSLSAHKIGGPVGTGALILDRGLSPVPVLHGGGQERGVRSGTLDVAGATAFAAAAEAARDHLTDGTVERMARLRDRLLAGIARTVPDAVVTGPWEAPDASGVCEGESSEADRPAEPKAAGRREDRPVRLPANAHAVFPGCEGDSLLYLLDMAGFATSTGSACQAGVSRPSHVLMACGFSEDEARSTQRFSLGPDTTVEEVDRLLAVLPDVVTRARKAGMVSATPRWAG